MATETISVYPVVLFEGTQAKVAEVKRRLGKTKDRLLATNAHTLGLSNVQLNDLPVLKKRLASSFGLKLVQCLEPCEMEVRTKPRPKGRTATKLNLKPKKWYFAESIEDHHPFVYVREVQSATDNGDQYFLLELVDAENGLPTKLQVSAADVATFGLRPATAEDFDEYGMIIPTADSLTTASVTKPEPEQPCCKPPNKEALASFRLDDDLVAVMSPRTAKRKKK